MIYIYALFCPVALEIRYVGKSVDPQSRFIAHITTAKTGRGQHHTARWIRKLLKRNLLPELRILAEVNDGECWKVAERRFIADARALGWPLTNTTDGGDAVPILDQATRDRAAPKMAASMRKVWADPEKRKRFLESMRDPELLRRRSVTQTRINADPVYKAKQRAALKLTCSTPEYQVVASARAKAMHANPEQSARRTASLSAAALRPEVKAKRAAAMAEVYARPEFKVARSVASKAAWRDPVYREKVMSAPNKRERMSASQKARFATPEGRAKFMETMNAPARTAKIAAAMTARNADPSFRAKVNDPEVRARAAATLRETWARRKREAAQQSEGAAVTP